MKKILIATLVVFFCLNGCAHTKIGRAKLADRAKYELVGKTKTEILMCAGAPVRSEREGDFEFITYFSGGDKSVYVDDEMGYASVKKRYCEVTFVLQNGVVQKVNYTGRTGGLATKGEQCAFVLQNCVEE